MESVHPKALFRLTVIGSLISRDSLAYGELKAVTQELAQLSYDIPHSKHTHLSEKTIESWYYLWKKGGVDALTPKKRLDRGRSKIPQSLQESIVQAKKENPQRSLNTLLELMKMQDLQGAETLTRSSIYRLLLSHQLSRPSETIQPKELRRFEADYPSDIIYGDVMHGPKVVINGKIKKSYLVSLMDDKSRLILHSAFCPGETALDIEHVLKQALLRRGLPKRLVLDNGAAYRSKSLQGICARLNIQLIYCKPYAPEGKGKIERWHRTLRAQFLTELSAAKMYTLEEMNSQLFAWIDQIYHPRRHSSLNGKSPLMVWQDYIEQVKPLGHFASRLDEIFYHRVKRKVRKDGSISYEGKSFEVPYLLAQKDVFVVIDPYQQKAIYIENEEGIRIGDLTPLDLQANRNYKRQTNTTPSIETNNTLTHSVVDLAMHKQQQQLVINPKNNQK
jgi:transposase InsO family protein